MPELDECTLEATVIRRNRMRILVATLGFPVVCAPVMLAVNQGLFDLATSQFNLPGVIVVILAAGLIGFAATPISINALARKSLTIALPVWAVLALMCIVPAVIAGGMFAAFVAGLLSLTIVPLALGALLPDQVVIKVDRCPQCLQLCPPTGASICPECGFLFVVPQDPA